MKNLIIFSAFLFVLSIYVTGTFAVDSAASASVVGSHPADLFTRSSKRFVAKELKDKGNSVKWTCYSDYDCEDRYGNSYWECNHSTGQCEISCDYYDGSSSDCEEFEESVKLAVGIIIALVIVIPLVCIASITACCFCCSGCPGHSYRQRRSQATAQVFVPAQAYDQQGNPIQGQYGAPPPGSYPQQQQQA